ncbi:hypothetical protein [Promicromonospora sukumoe]|uniref:hypothetical protein n=1 Tax=Promicromonospora sukumoe TaxID=88382 RepID=UPI0003600B40|nr:hypothetical protein [Promicromonospora sukumoe]
MTVVTISSKADTTAADTIAADAGTADAGSRHAQALAALRSAEARTGVRKQATPTRVVQAVRAERAHEQPGQEQPRVQVRALRGGLLTEPLHVAPEGGSVAREARPAAAEVRPAAGPASSSGSRVGHPGEDTRVLPVHPHLAALLPDGGLRAGTTVLVRGSTSLLLTLLAEASRDGAWTVLVGYPAAGLAAAADAGCDLARTLVVPLPAGSGVDAPAVLAALIDGMDVVVVGPEVALLDQDRRRLTARARDRGTVLLPTAPSGAAGGWAGAHVVLEATAGDWAGVDHGVGWLRRRTLRVRRTGRGSAARPVHLDVELPVCRAAGPGLVQARAAGAVARDEAAESGRTPLELVG